jgi:hypothetical protein
VILDPILDILRGKAVTIPPLDGAFRANVALDDAPLFAELQAPDNLAVADGRVIASSGDTLFALADGAVPAPLQSFRAEVTALAVAPSGELGVALESGALWLGDESVPVPSEVRSITALAFGPDGSLWLANGSARHAPSDWAADLMEKNALGSVWRRDAGSEAFRKVVGDLAYPYGLLADGGRVVVSESWRHRLVRLDAQTGRVTSIAEHLPGYPARLAPAAGGGAWLAVFAPRNRLIELVLQETHYRTDMMAGVPREYWIAPALASGRSFLEPLQCGGIKTMGIHKPWAPSRSCGMAARLDTAMSPVSSVHSRSNGTRHGTCSVVELGGRLLVAAKGGDCVLAVDVSDVERI